MLKTDTVSILLCTYNGEKYIREQLDSIINQTYPNWTLHISDDGSIDETLAIIHEYKEKLPAGKLIIYAGPRKGFASNFLSLIKNRDIQSNFYAFSDQDDIWLEHKLEKAIKAVQQTQKNSGGRYALYGGRTTLINNQKEVVGHSCRFKRAFKLENALLQSYSGGNTMLFNYALKEKIEQLPDNIPIVSHDWYLYIICSAFNGDVIYDDESQILYRQHENNIVGSNSDIKSKIERLKRLYQGQFAEWNKINEMSLDFYFKELPVENQKLLTRFFKCRGENIFGRMRSLIYCRVYRQSFIETVFFYFMNAFGKLF